MRITKLHLEVVEALFTQRATPAEIYKRFRITPKRLAIWLADPVFKALLVEIEARHKRRARWLFIAFAEVAAARLVKLTETESAETARKACLDVLEGGEPPKTPAPEGEPGQTFDPNRLDAETRSRILELAAGALAEGGAPERPASAAEAPPAQAVSVAAGRLAAGVPVA